jgi:hypothetical protein
MLGFPVPERRRNTADPRMTMPLCRSDGRSNAVRFPCATQQSNDFYKLTALRLILNIHVITDICVKFMIGFDIVP